MWRDRGMQWLAKPSGKRGRGRTFSDAAIQFCLSIKCLLEQALPQTLGLVESLLRLAGHWPVPDYSMVCRRQKTLQAQRIYRPSAESLQLLVDSTGPMLTELLAQIVHDEAIASVAADGSYDMRGCRDAIAQRGAVAVIAPQKNARLWRRPSSGAESRNETVRACRRMGHGIRKTWSGYHQRGLVETKMHCLKRLGERVTARTFERQMVELHVRVAVLNRFSQIDRPKTVPVVAVA